MAEEKAYTLSNEDLLKVAGGKLEVGMTVQMAVCPFCFVQLEEGPVECPELNTINPTTGRMERGYTNGFRCKQCSYAVTSYRKLPFFKILEGGELSLVP